MVKMCEDCCYYSKINGYATCHYSEATTNIHDGGISCPLLTGKMTTEYDEIPYDDEFDDPYPNESYLDWRLRLSSYSTTDNTKRIFIKPEELKEPEKPVRTPSRFDDII
jgi:hypothetical protein